MNYVNELVRRTREWPHFHMGASPRAGIALVQGARTLAAFRGRDYAVPDDVVEMALPALRHRVMLTAEAEVEGRKVDELLSELIRSVEVPRLVSLLSNPLTIPLALLVPLALLALGRRIYPHRPLVLLASVPMLMSLAVLFDERALMPLLYARRALGGRGPGRSVDLAAAERFFGRAIVWPDRFAAQIAARRADR